MPFVSQQQRKFAFATKQPWAEKWAAHTPKGEKLPKHAHEDIEEGEQEDREMAIKSAGEERKAIDDYGDRAQRTDDPDLRSVFLHSRGEEQDHLDDLEAWLGVEDEYTEPESSLPMMSVVFGDEPEDQPEYPSSDGPPRMESVFRLKEAPVQNRPPPGSQPVRPTEWNQLGQRGQALDKGLKALQSAGQEMTPYKTPAGDTIAFPKQAAPGRGPMKADVTKGIWTNSTGSQGAGTGTPVPPASPTTTMK